ncbi:STAS domain-containing protein [Nocardia sp. NPDC004068]|uniref:STAS domain-containing protein n=1 Tax=Nocardia sp. NPDC004068 TaxID=3364303 RepID=UPI0036811493
MQSRDRTRSVGPDGLLTATVGRLPDAVVVTAAGEIDLATVAHLRAALDQAVAAPEPVLIVDLTEVEFIGSTGLSALLAAAEAAAPRPLRLLASPRVRRPLAVTGLDRILSVYSDLVAARTAL